MQTWNYVETREIDQFSLILDWTNEDMALGDAFDETEHDLEEMIRRCNDYTDTHYIARIRCFYNNKEMSSTTLGSCYAYGCDPADDMTNGIGGYLDQMINEVLEEARTEAVKMLEQLQKDFLVA